MQPIQGERRRRAGQKHRLCAAADTAGVRGGLSTHYAAFIYDRMAIKRVTYNTLSYLVAEIKDRYAEKSAIGALGGA